MSDCASCGRPVDGVGTHCDRCRTARNHRPAGDSDHRNATTQGSGSARDAERSTQYVATFLGASALIGGLPALTALTLVPELLRYPGRLDFYAPWVGIFTAIPLLVAFAVMAKRLLDGTADHDRYATVLSALGGTTVLLGILDWFDPDGVPYLLPHGFDPGFVLVDVLLQELGFAAVSPTFRFLVPVLVGPLATFLAAYVLAETPSR